MTLHPQRHLDTVKVFKSLDLSPRANILDFGCGVGYLSLKIKALGYNVYGVDKDIEIVKIAINDFDLIKCDIENEPLPFENHFFNCVLFTEVIEHLNNHKLNFVLNEIWRVLKENGVLLLTTPNQSSFQNVIRLFLGRKIMLEHEHVREYVMKELLDLLENSEFKSYRKLYLLSSDKVLSKSRGYIFVSNKINIIRILLYPIKLLIPRFRSLILILARKKRERFE
jgi:2-polyprenyl-3-methyl-5-hydroxy-6-metoxy-1,4-benzoquinol methylase